MRKFQDCYEVIENEKLIRGSAILELVEKNKGSVYRELKNLIKRGLIEKLELVNIEGRQKIVYYKKKK